MRNSDSQRPKAVLFDLGGTLFEDLPAKHSDHNLLHAARQVGIKASAEAILECYSKYRAVVSRRLLHEPFYLHRALVEEAFIECCAAFGIEAESNTARRFSDAQCAAVVAYLRPRTDCFSTLTRLRELGVLLGIVSNIDEAWLQPLVAKWQLSHHVDFITSSEAASICKPAPEIFQQSCRRLGVAPADALFVGDSELHDIEGAQAVGMQSALIREPAQPETSSVADFQITSLGQLLEGF